MVTPEEISREIIEGIIGEAKLIGERLYNIGMSCKNGGRNGKTLGNAYLFARIKF